MDPSLPGSVGNKKYESESPFPRITHVSYLNDLDSWRALSIPSFRWFCWHLRSNHIPLFRSHRVEHLSTPQPSISHLKLDWTCPCDKILILKPAVSRAAVAHKKLVIQIRHLHHDGWHNSQVPTLSHMQISHHSVIPPTHSLELQCSYHTSNNLTTTSLKVTTYFHPSLTPSVPNCNPAKKCRVRTSPDDDIPPLMAAFPETPSPVQLQTWIELTTFKVIHGWPVKWQILIKYGTLAYA